MISIPAYGGYDQLKLVPLPECGYTQGANLALEGIDESNCLLVKTYACGVNYADVIIRWGLYSSAKDFVGLPITPGFEFSGEVVSLGNNAKEFKVGDKVAGVSLFGSYSQKILVPKNQLRKIPENVSMADAAGFLTVGLTAWYAVYELCKLRKGDSVLVHSAAGGVGSMIVQMTKKIGCNVIGVVGRSHKVEIAKQMGCDAVIDKSIEPHMWLTAEDLTVNGYKAIFDANGIETLQESYNHLSKGGRLVAYGGASLMPRSTPDGTGHIKVTDWLKIAWKYRRSPTFNPLEMTTDNKSVMAFNLSYMFQEKEMMKESIDELFTWLADGSIKVSKVTEYKLKDAASAHRDLESGNTVGKLVLLTQDEEENEIDSETKEELKVESDSKELLQDD